jgi:solute carrier family 25 (mitochondrial carnitine/acylcarnitine transporter), member 20/29
MIIYTIIKTRIQASGQPNVKGIYSTALEILEESNGRVSALYRGFGLKLVRSIPASMIGFTVYELVADQLK